MRSLLIIATIVALSAAKPGGYHHQHYQFEQSSAAYRNNELQHKSDETGRYTKFEDQDSSDEPQENMNYHRTEYNAPSAAAGVKGGRRVWKPTTNRDLFAEDTQTNVDKGLSDSQSLATDLDTKIIPAAGSQVQEESQSHTSQSSVRFGSIDTTSVDDHHPHFGHHGRYHGHPGYYGHDHSGNFHRNHGEEFQRGYHGHHTEEFHRQHGEAFAGHHGMYHGHRRFHSQDDFLTTSEPEVLQPIEDDDTTFNYDKFKQYGFGKEYLDNTEGATNNAGTGVDNTGTSSTNTNRGPNGFGSSTSDQNPGLTTSNIGQPNRDQYPVFTSLPVDRTTGISSTAPPASSEITTSIIETTKPDQGSLFVSPTSPTNQNTAGSSGFTTNTAANSGFADSGNRANSHIGQENVKPVYEAPEPETISQSSVARASEDDLMKIFAKIDQIAKDMAETQQQETQHGMSGTPRLDQYGRDKLDPRHATQQQITNIRTAQTFDSTQQQRQFDSQDFTQQSTVQFNQGQQKDLTQQTQVDDLIEKTDEDSGKLEVASQIRGDQHNDMTQHGQGHLTQLQNKDVGKFTLENLTQQTQDGFGSQHQEDLTQQTQDGFSKLTQDDLTQQTQDDFDKLEFGSQHQQSQDMTQQSQMDSFAQQTSRHHSQQQNQGMLNMEYHQTGQQTQDGFGKLEMGSQVADQHDLRTQQAQGESSKLEHGSQQQEDLTQQTQDAFGKLVFGGQQEDLTQQTQDEFGKLEFVGQEDLTQQTQENLTQQTQDEFGKLEFAGQEDLTQHEDLTQQTQDEFGKLEFGQQQQEDLTQQTEDGFGKLEIASQNHGTQHQSQHSRSHSYSGSNSYSTNYNYGEQRAIAAETTQDLAQQQKAHETLDVTQQVQKVDDLKLEEQKESNFNQMSSHDILAKQTNVDETVVEEEPTVKPGFWKRVGSSISKTYEKAKVSLG